MHDVFLSHATPDLQVVTAICHALEQRGVRCWYAKRDAEAGAPWTASITGAIDAARILVLVLSGDSNVSQHVRKEVTAAVKRGLHIIPFRIEDIEPSEALEYLVGDCHWLDALTPPRQEQIQRLVETVTRVLETPDDAPPARSAPGEPSPATRRRAGLLLAGVVAAVAGAVGVWQALDAGDPPQAPSKETGRIDPVPAPAPDPQVPEDDKPVEPDMPPSKPDKPADPEPDTRLADGAEAARQAYEAFEPPSTWLDHEVVRALRRKAEEQAASAGQALVAEAFDSAREGYVTALATLEKAVASSREGTRAQVVYQGLRVDEDANWADAERVQKLGRDFEELKLAGELLFAKGDFGAAHAKWSAAAEALIDWKAANEIELRAAVERAKRQVEEAKRRVEEALKTLQEATSKLPRDSDARKERERLAREAQALIAGGDFAEAERKIALARGIQPKPAPEPVDPKGAGESNDKPEPAAPTTPRPARARPYSATFSRQAIGSTPKGWVLGPGVQITEIDGQRALAPTTPKQPGEAELANLPLVGDFYVDLRIHVKSSGVTTITLLGAGGAQDLSVPVRHRSANYGWAWEVERTGLKSSRKRPRPLLPLRISRKGGVYSIAVDGQTAGTIPGPPASAWFNGLRIHWDKPRSGLLLVRSGPQ